MIPFHVSEYMAARCSYPGHVHRMQRSIDFRGRNGNVDLSTGCHLTAFQALSNIVSHDAAYLWGFVTYISEINQFPTRPVMLT